MENQQLTPTTSRLLARSNDVRMNGALTIADAALPAAQAAAVSEVVGSAVSGAITWCGDVQRVAHRQIAG